MEALPATTLLQYTSSDSTEYVAIVLQDKVLAVRRAGDPIRQEYSGIYPWIRSLSSDEVSWKDIRIFLPGQLSDEQKSLLSEVEEKQETDEKQEEKKAKATIHLIPLRQPILSTRWTHHLYRMMKEANPALLKQEAVIQAFNHLVDVLLAYQTHVYTFIPTPSRRYSDGVNINSTDIHRSLLKDVCEVQLNSVYFNVDTGRPVIRHRFYRQSENKYEENYIRGRILVAYRPLFELIHGDVTPYMEQKNIIHCDKERDRQIESLVNQMDRLQVKNDEEIARRLERIRQMKKIHERKLLTFRTAIAEISAGRGKSLF